MVKELPFNTVSIQLCSYHCKLGYLVFTMQPLGFFPTNQADVFLLKVIERKGIWLINLRTVS